MRTAVAIAAVLLILPAAAQASVVTRGGELIRHTPSPFTEDVFVLTDAGGTATFQIAPNLNAGSGCQTAGTNTVTCPEAGATAVILDLGDFDDSVSVGGLFGGGEFSLPIEIHGDDGADILSMGTERDVMFGGNGNDRLLAGDGQDNLFGGEGDDLLSGGPGADFIDGGGGNDDLIPSTGADSIQGGSGADRLVLGAGNDTVTLDEQANDGTPGEGKNVHGDIETIEGGDGNDHLVGNANTNTLRGGRGADALEGGDGADLLEGGEGPDDLHGGTNFDQVSYSEAAGQRVTLDDIADDGAPGEGDNVHSDVESVAGGPGNDTLIGNAAANTLDGGDGNDELRGGGGVDTFLGGPGDDRIFARDGLPERVDCGPGGGTATVDTVDTVLGCTSTDVSDELVPDLDHDGVSRPADCDDRNAAIRPGAPEIVNNAVDENCDGRADFDRDLDGAKAPPAGRDCNDGNSRIKPGAREIPGNRVDENCDGKADPFPLLESSVGALFITVGADTRFTDFFVRRGRRGSKIRLLCSGPGCRWKSRTVKVKRNRRTVSLMRPVRRLVLHPGARLKVRITKPRVIGGAIRFAIRSGKPPGRRDDCLFPGRKRPRRCPG